MRWALLGFTLMSALATASPNDCYAIRDKDKQNYCLATLKGDTSRCYSIRDKDAQRLCLAEVRDDRSTCYSIKDKDTKNLCLARSKR